MESGVIKPLGRVGGPIRSYRDLNHDRTTLQQNSREFLEFRAARPPILFPIIATL